MDNLLAPNPRGYQALMAASFRLYRASFKRVILMSLVLAFIVLIPRFLSDIIGEDLIVTLPLLDPHRLWLMLVDFGAFLFFIAILWHMHCELVNKNEPFTDDLQMGVKKFFFAVIATAIACMLGLAATLIIYSFQLYHNQPLSLAGVGVIGQLGIGLLLFIQGLLTLYISLLFLFITPLIATEDSHILQAIAKSVLLSYRHPFRILFLQLTPWAFFTLILSIFSTFGFNIHLFFMETTAHTIGGTLVNLILLALFLPWIGALLLLQLHDLELRRKMILDSSIIKDAKP